MNLFEKKLNLIKFVKVISTTLISLIIFYSASINAITATNPSSAQANGSESPPSSENPPNNLKEGQGKKPTVTTKGLIQQIFSLHGSAELKLQFRYINGNLKYLYFWNTGLPVTVNVFSNDYVIGEGDDDSIKAPNVGAIVINVYPYDPTESNLPTSKRSVKKTYIFTKGKDGLYIMHAR